MILKNKYFFGCQVQYYELEMFQEHINSLKQMVENVDNKENITFHFLINFQQHFEKIDWQKFYEDYGRGKFFINERYGFALWKEEFSKIYGQIPYPCKLNIEYKFSKELESYNEIPVEVPFYNIADYRRDISWNNCTSHDFVCWSETDSLWPKQTLEVIEGLMNVVGEQFPKFVANFAGRKNWDSSWDQIVHPLYEKVQYQDNDEWIFNNEASEKSYMSLERMNEINDIDMSKIEIHSLTEPKADGSCLIFSSELLKSGVTLPKSLILHGEDESMLRVAKRIMGDQFIQFHIHNILRVHNRRHPKKRMFILNEDNPNGICTNEKKGNWWGMLEEKSKFNLETLFQQQNSKKL